MPSLHRMIAYPPPAAQSAEAARSSRRRFLRRLTRAGIAVAAAGVWTRFCEPHWLDVVHHVLRIPLLPGKLAGKRILLMSDLHLGRTDEAYVGRVIQHANMLAPDLIALTGDFINHNSVGSMQSVTRLLRALTPPPLGIFACLGNHDYGRGWSQTAVADAVARAVRSAGVTMLRNQSTLVAGLQIVGLDDLWTPGFAPHAVLASIDPNRPALCLCHNPDMCDRPVWSAFRGVILSGHTHGGQCKLPFFPPPFLPVYNRRYVAGEYVLDSRRTLYISRGVGHTLPVRFNCRPEITLFTLCATHARP